MTTRTRAIDSPSRLICAHYITKHCVVHLNICTTHEIHLGSLTSLQQASPLGIQKLDELKKLFKCPKNGSEVPPTALLVRVLMKLEPEELSHCDQPSRFFHGSHSPLEQALRQLANEDQLRVP